VVAVLLASSQLLMLIKSKPVHPSTFFKEVPGKRGVPKLQLLKEVPGKRGVPKLQLLLKELNLGAVP